MDPNMPSSLSSWLSERLEVHALALKQQMMLEHQEICAELLARLRMELPAELAVPHEHTTAAREESMPKLRELAHPNAIEEPERGPQEPVLEETANTPEEKQFPMLSAWVQRIDDGVKEVVQDINEAIDQRELAMVPDEPEEEEQEAEATNSTWKRFTGRFKGMVTSPYFDAVFCFIIVLHTANMAAMLQCRGIANGYSLGFGESPEIWSDTHVNFQAIETFLGIVFVIEITLKLLALRSSWYGSVWNWLDSVCVSAWLIELAGATKLPFDPMIFRLIRLGRLLRLLRLVKVLEMFDSLRLLVHSIRASISILLWANVLLFLLLIMCSIIFTFVTEDFITGNDHQEEAQMRVYQYYGTTSRSFFTMFEVTLANWVPAARVLTENVNESFAVFFMAYKSIVGFSVVTVITGVFMQETFKRASTSYEIMILNKHREELGHHVRMAHLFKQADASSDGSITWTEFCRVLENEEMKTWMAAMELDVSDGKLLFDLLSNGDDDITVDELVDGVAKLKGAARSIHMQTLIRQASRIEKLLQSAKGTTT